MRIRNSLLLLCTALLSTVAVTAAVDTQEPPQDHMVVAGLNDGGRELRTRGWGGEGVTKQVGCHYGCPKDERFDETCLTAALPPFPMCRQQTAEEWVKKAVDSKARCCGDDRSACRCPVTTSERFLGAIDAKCAGIDVCVQVLMMMESKNEASVTVERVEVP